MNEIIHVALAIDKPYVQHVGVLLCSLFEHNPKNSFFIYLIIDFDENKELKKLKAFVKSYGQELKCFPIQNDRLKEYKLSGHATTAVYYRLLLPEILDTNLKKVLYLDSDIIIKRDLLPLWNTELEDYPLAAIREPLFNRYHQLGIPENVPYFNSGVMLINLPLWRAKGISERAANFIESYPERILFWDQDGLNAVLQGDWLELKLKWNQQTQLFQDLSKITSVKGEDLQESLHNPAIIHYSSKFKPWHYWCNHPLKEEYFIYLKKTPWRCFRIEENTIWHLIKQRIKSLFLLKEI